MNRICSPVSSRWALVLLAAATLALGVLSVEASVKSRTSYGGTAPKNVLAQAKAWLKRLEKERKLG